MGSFGFVAVSRDEHHSLLAVGLECIDGVLSGYSPDLNFYTYVGNDPTNRTDPKGLMDDFTAQSYADAVMQMSPAERATLVVTMGLAFVPGAYELGGVLAAGPLLSAGISGEITSARGGSATDIGTSFAKGGIVAGATELTGMAGGGTAAAMGAAGLTDLGVGVGLDLGTKGQTNIQENLEDAVASALGAGAGSLAGKALGAQSAGAGLGSALARQAAKKTASAVVKNTVKGVMPNPHPGSGRSALFGQTVHAQGTRVGCQPDSSGQRPSTC